MAPIKSRTAAAKTKEPLAPVTPTSHTGIVLREAREKKNMTIEALSNELMIRRFYLEALEQGSFKDLPERVYATGFVRNYAQFIGLDTVETVEQFKREAYGSRDAGYRVELSMPEPIIQSVVPTRNALLGGIGAIILIAAAAFFVARDITPVSSPVPLPPPAADMPEPQKVDLSTTGAVPSTTLPTEGFASATEVQTEVPAKVAETTESDATSAVAKREIFLEALESSWLEVKDGKGVILFTSILKQGQKLPIPDQNDITVTTGNAGGLRLLLNDKIVAPLGQANEVKRNIPLDRFLSSQN